MRTCFNFLSFTHTLRIHFSWTIASIPNTFKKNYSDWSHCYRVVIVISLKHVGTGFVSPIAIAFPTFLHT